MPQLSVGEAQPARLAGAPQRRLHHRQGDRFGVGQPRRDPDSRAGRGMPRRDLQQIVSTYMECRGEGVRIGVHEDLRGSTLGQQRRAWAPSPLT
jgi:hypothetical protein